MKTTEKKENPAILTMPSGKVRKFSEWGSYPLFYLTGTDRVLCPECVEEDLEAARDGAPFERVASHRANWENSCLHCDECGTRIESAYAEHEVDPAE